MTPAFYLSEGWTTIKNAELDQLRRDLVESRMAQEALHKDRARLRGLLVGTAEQRDHARAGCEQRRKDNEELGVACGLMANQRDDAKRCLQSERAERAAAQEECGRLQLANACWQDHGRNRDDAIKQLTAQRDKALEELRQERMQGYRRERTPLTAEIRMGPFSAVYENPDLVILTY